MVKLLKTQHYTAENRRDLARLVQILKDFNYPKVELVDIISIALMLDYILSDERLIELYYDFICSSVDVIDYILNDRTYLKIEDRIIYLESEFYTIICDNPIEHERRFLGEMKMLIKQSCFKH